MTANILIVIFINIHLTKKCHNSALMVTVAGLFLRSWGKNLKKIDLHSSVKYSKNDIVQKFKRYWKFGDVLILQTKLYRCHFK